MSTSQLEDLKTAHANLLAQYDKHLEDVRALQRAVLEDVLPDVLEETVPRADMPLHEEVEVFAREWLQDEASVFRILRRHRFTRSFALEHLHNTLVWRLRMQPLLQPEDTPEDICTILPPSATDISGRPITVVRACKLASLPCSDPSKSALLRVAETLRLHTLYTNMASNSQGDGRPVLQVAMILDMANVSVYEFDIELLRWFTSDAYPRFPGLVGPIFVVNFSWTQGGIWSVVKRILPPSVLKRVIFVNLDQLAAFILRTSLPSEYGGTLEAQAVEPATVPQGQPSDIPAPSRNSSLSRVRSLLPRSILNPFFGYPVTSAPGMTRHSSVPALRHGRRRKRDLVRTLLILWWERWGVFFQRASGAAVILCLVLAVTKLRRRVLRV